MNFADLALLASIIGIGAGLQRLTGMGFALVASPFLVLTLGPIEGILVTNACGVVSSLLNLTMVHRDVKWRRLLRFTPFSLAGIALGALVLKVLPADPLAILVGVLILLVIAVTVLARPGAMKDTIAVSSSFGAASGFMNVTAGVGGPALAVYGVATGWAHKGFAASAQAHFLLLSALSLAAKSSLPSMGGTGWVVTIGAILIGAIIGQRLAGRFEDQALMRVVLVLSAAGAVMTIVQALI